jgi:hypothetical protein
MAEALQHGQTAFIARISATGAADDEPVTDTTRSDRANAIISPSRWYKKSVRPQYLAQEEKEDARLFPGLSPPCTNRGFSMARVIFSAT